MFEYKVEGGFPIQGTVAASGNKNAALPCIAASLLTEEPVILRNIPDIEDTGVMLLILHCIVIPVLALCAGKSDFGSLSYCHFKYLPK